MEAPARIEVEEGERVVIEWPDGATSRFSARDLRAACQCATCREPAGRRHIHELLESDKPIRIRSAGLVGAYGVSFHFSPDEHRTGIYTFEVLRALEGGR